jgi:hypothetical protein
MGYMLTFGSSSFEHSKVYVQQAILALDQAAEMDSLLMTGGTMY